MKQNQMNGQPAGLPDIPALLLREEAQKTRKAYIEAAQEGMLCGMRNLVREAELMGLEVLEAQSDGAFVAPGDKVACLRGSALSLLRGEDMLLGLIGKPSGVATAAHLAKTLQPDLRIVSGSWKKIPHANKEMLREGLAVAKVGLRITDTPFVYLDKNYIRILGSVARAVKAAKEIEGREVCAQLRGELQSIEDEALDAIAAGADILMVDTGNLEDLRQCDLLLKEKGLRNKVRLAFAGCVTHEMLGIIREAGADIVDMGRALLDAPMVDFRYDVELEHSN